MHGAWAHTPAQAQAKFNDPRLDFFLMNQVKSYIAIIKTRSISNRYSADFLGRNPIMQQVTIEF